MRIAIVSTPFVSIPPKKYGGTELFVYNLATQLISKGHEVFLFTTGDSYVKGATVGYRFDKPIWPPSEAAEKLHMEGAVAWLHDLESSGVEIEVVHWNSPLGSSFSKNVHTPAILTWHDRTRPELSSLYAGNKDIHYVAISQRQKDLEIPLQKVSVIHHGIDPIKIFSDVEVNKNLVGFLGRMAPEKGPDTAIRVARAAGYRLALAGPVHNKDSEFFMENVRPLLGPDVYLIGEIGGETKFRFLQSISAFVMPIRWEEPFGLVMIEALFCGTPVVAFRQGAAPEIVENGVTGFIVDTEEQMKEALHKSKTLDREKVREITIRKFSSEIMTHKYITLYKNVVKGINPSLS